MREPSSPSSSPGISVAALLGQASEKALRELVGRSVIGVLELLDSSFISRDSLSKLALQLIDPVRAMREPTLRAKLVDLLPLSKAQELARRLQLPIDGSLYKRLTRAAANKSNEALLFSFFGIVEERRAVTISPSGVSEVAPGYGLFDYQLRSARRVKAFLAEPPRKVVLHMPTGSGKTRTAMHLVAEHISAAGPTLVCWLAQSAELLEQACSEFELAWFHLGNHAVGLYRFWGDYAPPLENARDGLLVAGLAKLQSLYTRDFNMLLRLADRTSLTVMDEAHQAIAPTYRSLIEILYGKQPQNALLGLTATPGRTWANIAEDEILSDFFNDAKVTLEVEGYDDPVAFLINQGYLARPTFRTLNSEAGLALSEADIAAMAASLEVPETVLARLAEDDQRNLRIITMVEELCCRHRRIIVFAASVAHARLLAAILAIRDHEAYVVTADTDAGTRQRVIRRYKSAAPNPIVLCNYGVLTTGFDAPGTSAALIARPTKSLVLYSQMVGRATRGPRAGGNETAEIVTVVDPHLPGFGSLAEAFTNWEDVWYEYDRN